MSEILLIAAFAAIALTLFAAAWILARASLAPAVRRFLILLLLVEVILLLLHTTTWNSADVTRFSDWFFDLDMELNLGTTFSSAQFAVIGLTALVIGLRVRPAHPWHRFYWGLLAAGFFFLSKDEYFIIHEQLFERANLPGEWWRYLYAGVGALLVALSVVIYWRWLRGETRTFALFLMGLVVMAVSGVALERLIWNARCSSPHGCFDRLLAFEEIFELVGATLVLAGFLIYAHRHLAPAAWRSLLRLQIGGGLVWMAGLLFWLWGLPLLELRLLAEPTEVMYLDGALELVGYQVSDANITPGEALDVTLYWRAAEPLPENYNQSVRLFAKPDGEQVAQFDLEALDVAHVPSRAWLPGAVMRSSVRLPVPEDLPTPASFWLAVRLWYGDWQDTRGVDVTEAEERLLTPDVAVIDSVAAIGEMPEATPEVMTNAQFDAGLTLTGYTLPDEVEAGEKIDLEFQWQVDEEVDGTYTQFVHFVDDEGELAFGHDQPPFEGTFPTEDWPSGETVQDTWQVSIPGDLPPGEYEVFTGVYDSETGQRSPVQDETGQPLPDDAISLGEVVVEG